jgi:Tfp pilus assembly protein PilO
MYTDPQYQSLKALQAQAAEYDDALGKAQDLRKIRDDLLSKRNTFKPDSLVRLEHALPDNVDNIRLIIDINNVAARHGLSLASITVGTVSNSSTARSPLAVGSSGDAVGSVSVGFAVTASYDDFLAFLHDLEHSLRIVDVEDISFTASDRGLMSYTVTIRTYWLH